MVWRDHLPDVANKADRDTECSASLRRKFYDHMSHCLSTDADELRKHGTLFLDGHRMSGVPVSVPADEILGHVKALEWLVKRLQDAFDEIGKPASAANVRSMITPFLHNSRIKGPRAAANEIRASPIERLALHAPRRYAWVFRNGLTKVRHPSERDLKKLPCRLGLQVPFGEPCVCIGLYPNSTWQICKATFLDAAFQLHRKMGAWRFHRSK